MNKPVDIAPKPSYEIPIPPIKAMPASLEELWHRADDGSANKNKITFRIKARTLVSLQYNKPNPCFAMEEYRRQLMRDVLKGLGISLAILALVLLIICLVTS